MVVKNGSAMIMILLLMVGITMIALTSLKSTIAFYELALIRMEHVRQKAAGHALLLYGIASCSAYKETMQECTVTFAQWPPPDGKYKGIVTSTPNNQGIWHVAAQLHKDGQLIYTAQRSIVGAENKWHIQL